MNDILKKQAHDNWYLLEDLHELNRLVNLGSFPGSDFKSVQKMHKFLEDSWKNTIKSIESNEWYQAEKKEMESLDMETIMKDGTGQYDPEYKVTMEDVFRKVFKEDKKKALINEKK